MLKFKQFFDEIQVAFGKFCRWLESQKARRIASRSDGIVFFFAAVTGSPEEFQRNTVDSLDIAFDRISCHVGFGNFARASYTIGGARRGARCTLWFNC